MKIKSVYDNEGRTVDRYTVTFTDGSALGLSENPDNPLGFSQWGDAVEGSHLGKRISVSELPKIIREHIRLRMEL